MYVDANEEREPSKGNEQEKRYTVVNDLVKDSYQHVFNSGERQLLQTNPAHLKRSRKQVCYEHRCRCTLLPASKCYHRNARGDRMCATFTAFLILFGVNVMVSGCFLLVVSARDIK